MSFGMYTVACDAVKVILRSNFDVSKGLVNGAIGNITAIGWPYIKRAQLDAREIPLVRIELEGGVGNHLIQPIIKEFPALGIFDTAKRRMLSIVSGYATIFHKMQGGIFDLVVADLSGHFAKGQAHVMLSRFTSLDGFKIEFINPVQLPGKKPCNTDALEEMEPMRKLPSAF